MSFLNDIFGSGSNPANAAMPYLNKIPGAVTPYYQPYVNAGNQALPQLENQYSDLINNPGAKVNQIGSNFQQSPGFQFALQQALQGAGHAAAAGGMAGSPEHEQQNMGIATQLGNQDYYNWLGNAENMYGTGLSGEGNLANMGYNASKSLSDQIAQALAAKAQLGYAGKAAQNQQEGSLINDAFGGAGFLKAFKL